MFLVILEMPEDEWDEDRWRAVMSLVGREADTTAIVRCKRSLTWRVAEFPEAQHLRRSLAAQGAVSIREE